jgi:hypothetical protein
VATVKISALPAAGTLSGAEQLPIVQDTVTRRTTVADLVAEAEALITAAVAGLISEAEMTTAIATAITDLVGAAPVALDTLNELAAALADDANFSATITAQVGAKISAAQHAGIDHTGLPGTGTEAIDAAVAAHAADTTAVHGIADTSALALTANVVGKGLLDAKGDLIAATAADTPARLAVGTDGYILTADSAEATGLKYVAPWIVTANRQTDSYTLVLGDAGKVIEMNKATANNLTVPLNATVPYEVGTIVELFQYGAGQTTVVATGGVTIRSSGGKLKLTGQYSAASLRKIATDEWSLVGDIST